MKHNWEYQPFKDIASLITPRIKVDKSEYMHEGLVPIISQEESYISGYWDNLNDITPHNGPVVIFGDHSRVLKYVDCDFVVGADGVKIISPKDCICAKFLYHFLKWYNIPSLGYSRHFKLIKEATFPLPHMALQQQIVAEFDKINETIDDCRELLRNLDTLAQSLFYDFFGDPITNPKSWEVKKLGKLLDVRDGTHDSPKYVIDGIPLITSKNLSRGYVDFDNANLISIDDANFIDFRSRVDIGDILMPMIGTIGNPVINLSNKRFCIKNVALIKFQGYDISNKYILYILKSNLFLQYIKYNNKGVSQKFLSLKLLREFALPVPPLPLQEKFAERIEAIEAQKKAVEQTIAELQTLLDSRMDYWFN
ncbi:MAG: restriction endonuclease subunit S [Muribaculaceae bacterium]|nr:restriction endonuclease subunit S [Muribaculaceae bacterium]